jgi:hypothetical protein
MSANGSADLQRPACPVCGEVLRVILHHGSPHPGWTRKAVVLHVQTRHHALSTREASLAGDRAVVGLELSWETSLRPLRWGTKAAAP